MPPSWPPDDFPNLNTDSCHVSSVATRQYNCIAWVAMENRRRWEPDPNLQYYWPPGVPREYAIAAVIKAYESIGFRLCYSAVLEPGVQKLALFGVTNQRGNIHPTHAALQLACGNWTSKLGDFEDVVHRTPEDVNGPQYGEVVGYMARARPDPAIASYPR